MQKEAMEQRNLIKYCNLRHIEIFAIPNGGRRNPKEAYFLKLEGCSAGVPDLCVPIPKGKYHGLFIELKVGKNKASENQKAWINYLNSVGYLAVVCYGCDKSIELIERYIKLEPNQELLSFEQK